MRSIVLAALACLGCAAGCTDGYSHMNVSSIAVGADLKGNFATAQVTVPVGGVVVFHATPYNSGNNPMLSSAVSEDPSTAPIIHAEGVDNYAVLGVRQGNTRVHLLADGVSETTMLVSVLAQ